MSWLIALSAAFEYLCYGYAAILNIFRRQLILTSKVDPRAIRVNYNMYSAHGPI